MVFGVHSERLRAIDSFHLDVAVSYGSWVGIIRQMETLVTLKFPDGSECKMPDRSVLHLLSHSLNKAFFWERGQFQTLSGLGGVKIFKAPFSQQFLTDLTPKVNEDFFSSLNIQLHSGLEHQKCINSIRVVKWMLLCDRVIRTEKPEWVMLH